MIGNVNGYFKMRLMVYPTNIDAVFCPSYCNIALNSQANYTIVHKIIKQKIMIYQD